MFYRFNLSLAVKQSSDKYFCKTKEFQVDQITVLVFNVSKSIEQIVNFHLLI